jgi:SAM-dependent methyltransferase
MSRDKKPPSDDSQTHLWESVHKAREHEPFANAPTQFATEIAPLLPSYASIIELGCGSGMDAVYFAMRGHSVIATDFSSSIIDQDIKRYKNIPNITFQNVDMRNELPFKSGGIDVVYARSSLHYFTDEVTRSIFQEIHRCLKVDGYLIFMCRSTADSLYGQGEAIGKDTYLREGHRRRFFSKSYVKSCLAGRFTITTMRSAPEMMYGYKANTIKVIAVKI